MCPEKTEGCLPPTPCFEVEYLYWYTYCNSGSAGLWGRLTFGMEDDSGRTGRILSWNWLFGVDLGGWGKEAPLGIHTVPTGWQGPLGHTY